MGFIVKHPVQTSDEKQYDEFYVRIENYQLNKVLGHIGTTIAHYETPEAAKKAVSDYVGGVEDPSGRLMTSMTLDPSIVDDEGKVVYTNWDMWHSFPLHEKVIVQEEVKTSRTETRTVEYIDFDEEGNEVVKTKQEEFEVIDTQIVDVEKTLKSLSLAQPDAYTYAYNQLKQIYASVFGEENIIDEI